MEKKPSDEGELFIHLAIRWFGLNDKIVESPVKRFEGGTIVRIFLPTGVHDFVVELVTIHRLDEEKRRGIERFSSSTNKLSAFDNP